MAYYQGKKVWYRIFRSGYFTLFLFFLSAYFLTSVIDVYKKNNLAKINAEEAVKNLATLNSKKVGLEEELERLKTERGVEDEIRRRFQVVKSGEHIMVIVDKNEGKKALEQVEDSLVRSIWIGFIGLFGF